MENINFVKTIVGSLGIKFNNLTQMAAYTANYATKNFDEGVFNIFVNKFLYTSPNYNDNLARFLVAKTTADKL